MGLDLFVMLKEVKRPQPTVAEEKSGSKARGCCTGRFNGRYQVTGEGSQVHGFMFFLPVLR